MGTVNMATVIAVAVIAILAVLAAYAIFRRRGRGDCSSCSRQDCPMRKLPNR